MDLKLIWICFKTSSKNIYLFPAVYSKLWKRNNDCFQLSRLRFSMIMTDAQWSMIRLRHMRHAIACAYLYTCLKHYRHAKKSIPTLIQKASRCAADRTSKTTTLFSFTFYKTQRSYKKIMCIYFLFHWFSGEIVLYFYFLYIKNDRLRKN